MSDKVLNEVDTKSTMVFSKVLTGAQMGYSTLSSLIRAAGGTVSATFETVISAAFSVMGILSPIFSAEAVTPGMQVQAALGFLQLGLSLAAITAAQANQSKLSEQIRTSLSAVRNTSSLIGFMSFN